MQTSGHVAHQIRLVVGEAGTKPAHGEGWPDHQRVAEVFGEHLRLIEGVRNVRAGNVGAGGDDQILEQLAVFALADCLDFGANEFDVVLLKNPGVMQGDGGIECRLAAEGRQDRVGTFLDDDRLDDVGRDRLDVGGIGEVRVGHDGGRVRVHQNDTDPLAAQHPTGLGAGVVKFGSLADDDRPGANDEHTVDVGTLGH